MKLKSLSLSDIEQVRLWRNQQIEMLRTPFVLTKEQQEQFYYDVVCNRQSNSKYFGLWINSDEFKPYEHTDGTKIQYNVRKDKLIGMAGIENIQWENRLGEISLLFDKEHTEEYFEEGLKLILDYGFNTLNLENIYTEVYACNLYLKLWTDMHLKYNGENIMMQTLEGRKYYKGKYYDSNYINFNKERYNEMDKQK